VFEWKLRLPLRAKPDFLEAGVEPASAGANGTSSHIDTTTDVALLPANFRAGLYCGEAHA